MSKLLVHIHSDLEFKNKVTLGLMVALAAEKSGHEVTLFLAADGVNILNCKSAGEIVGQGTGDLYEHLENLKNTNANILSQECPLRQGVTMRHFLMGIKQSLQCLINLLKSQLNLIASSAIENIKER